MRNVHTSRKPSCFVGQPILAAAGFQPALFVLRFVGFCRKRRSRQGSSVAHVNALRIALMRQVYGAVRQFDSKPLKATKWPLSQKTNTAAWGSWVSSATGS